MLKTVDNLLKCINNIAGKIFNFKDNIRHTKNYLKCVRHKYLILYLII